MEQLQPDPTYEYCRLCANKNKQELADYYYYGLRHQRRYICLAHKNWLQSVNGLAIKIYMLGVPE